MQALALWHPVRMTCTMLACVFDAKNTTRAQRNTARFEVYKVATRYVSCCRYAARAYSALQSVIEAIEILRHEHPHQKTEIWV